MTRPNAAQSGLDAAFFRVLDFLVLAVVCISYVAVALLALHAFDARLAAGAGLLLAAAARWRLTGDFGAAHASAGKPILPVILLVLLAATLLRAEPFRPLHGGQDQGVYVSMSAHLQRHGSVFVDDPLPAALPDEGTREIYASMLNPDPPWGAAVQPGIYYSQSPGQGDYVFQFYHLHPLWMATFAELFGDGARFRALTFFSLLSIVALCLLVLEISGSRMAALAAGLLLAVNPLHVFFSRLHVTEIVALAFSAVGLYYLARAARGVERAAPPASTAALAALSGLALSLVFFVRITGFLYLPLLAAVYGLGLWWTTRQRPAYARQVIGYGVLVAGLYAVSVLYGLRYSPVYALEIYYWRFAGLLGTYWLQILAGVSLGALAAAAALPFALGRDAVRRRLAFVARPGLWLGLATAAIALGVAGSLYQAYGMGYTERYAFNEFYTRFGVVGIGAPIFWRTGVVGWLLYTSPLLAAVAILGAHRAPRRWPVVLLYVLLAVCLFANLAVNVPVIYHHYYYARYLASEIVPYGIALAAAATFLSPSRRFRALGAAAMALTAPLHLYLVWQQLPVREGARPYAIMSEMADHVGDGVLLLDVEHFGGREAWRSYARLQTPLTYYFGKQVFPVEARNLDAVVAAFERADGPAAWMLSTLPSDHPCFRLVDTFDYWDTRMDNAAVLPVTVNERFWEQTLYLHRQSDVCGTEAPAFRLDDGKLYPVRQGSAHARRLLGEGWHDPEEGHVWSGVRQTLELSRGWFAAGRWPARLLLEIQPHAASPDHPVTLTVRSTGAAHHLAFESSEKALQQIPLHCPVDAAACQVLLEVGGARAPSEVGDSPDERTLGVALSHIGFAGGGAAP